MKAYGVTDIGKVRESNQDSFAVSVDGAKPVWAVVCDGMGGANGGYFASSTAVGLFSCKMDVSFDELKPRQIENVMSQAVSDANELIFNTALEQHELEGMGTTLVAVLICGENAYVIHVGDSRAYLINDQKIKKLTVDHSVVQQLIEIGQITEEEAKNHPEKNMITRAVGVKNEVSSDFSTVKLRKDDMILLCTDGLINYVDDSEIHEAAVKYDAETAAKKLVDLSLERGGGDNVTVVIIK